MTDATYARIVAHVKANATPPCDLFPDGLGVPIIQSWERDCDSPLLQPGSITVNHEDYQDLLRRAGSGSELAASEALPTVRRS